MTWVLELPYPRPPAGLHSNDRNHWRTKARSAAELRTLVVALAKAQNIPSMSRVSVQLVWVVGDHRKRDEDGPDPMTKVIFDAIGSDRGVSARIVHDDTSDYMEKPRPVIEHRAGATPHFEVRITDISNRPDTIDAITRRLT